MLYSPILLASLFCIAAAPALNAMCSRQNQTEDNENSSSNRFGSDNWYGPGFYYGIWFSEEDDYWQWRNQHTDYPPNHSYYHPTQPVRYDSIDHGGGGGHGGGHGGR